MTAAETERQLTAPTIHRTWTNEIDGPDWLDIDPRNAEQAQ
jgi:hypothetical protein